MKVEKYLEISLISTTIRSQLFHCQIFAPTLPRTPGGQDKPSCRGRACDCRATVPVINDDRSDDDSINDDRSDDDSSDDVSNDDDYDDDHLVCAAPHWDLAWLFETVRISSGKNLVFYQFINL